jgi:hypothetical protein
MNILSQGEICALFAELPSGFTRVGNRVLHPNLFDTVSVYILPVDGGNHTIDVRILHYLMPFRIMWEHGNANKDINTYSDRCASCHSLDHNCKHNFRESVLVGVSKDTFRDVFAWLNRCIRDLHQFIVWQGDDMIILPMYWRAIMHPALANIDAIHGDLHDPLCRVLDVFPVNGFKFRFDGVPNGIKIELVATYAGISLAITINDLLLPTYEVTVIIRGTVLSIMPDEIHCGKCKHGGNSKLCSHEMKTTRAAYYSENPRQTQKIGAAVGILVRDIQALAHPVPVYVPKERILKPLPDGGCLTHGDCRECCKRYLASLSESKMPLE